MGAAAAAVLVAGRCLRPPLESLDQMIGAAVGGAEEKAEVQLLLNCFELLAAAPLCLGRSSAAVGLPRTHSLTCCRSVTAADLVSMRERDEFGKGGRIQHTFPHCWADVTERHILGWRQEIVGGRKVRRNLPGLQ